MESSRLRGRLRTTNSILIQRLPLPRSSGPDSIRNVRHLAERSRIEVDPCRRSTIRIRHALEVGDTTRGAPTIEIVVDALAAFQIDSFIVRNVDAVS